VRIRNVGLRSASRLHDFKRQEWPLWFEAQGVDALHAKKGPAFSENYLIVRAAVAGQGLTLVRDIYVDDDLRSQRLVKALTVNWPLQFAYNAVATAEATQKPAIRRFRDWLVEEARQKV
jgi:LysR family glycine cleavage system transcriptional activator